MSLSAMVVAILSMGAVFTAHRAVSAQTPPSGPTTSVIFYTENDDWPPDTGTDKDYTNGFRLTIDRNADLFRLSRWRLFRWVPERPPCATASSDQEVCASTAVHFGQQFYTPDDITIAELIPDERPYAGWLYVGGSWRSGNIRRTATTDIYLGLTGRGSLARQVQTRWHELVDASEPRGWDHQIGGRLGAIVAHSRHWAPRALERARGGNRWLEVTPFVGGNAGNIVTDVYAGARLKLGYNIRRDWAHSAIGPVRLTSFDAGRPPAARRLEAFFSVDGRGRLTPYNVFLDATDRHHLDRRFAGLDGGVGVGLRVGSFMATYRVAMVSPEYDVVVPGGAVVGRGFGHHEFKALRLMYSPR